jgi:hypothetical protein
VWIFESRWGNTLACGLRGWWWWYSWHPSLACLVRIVYHLVSSFLAGNYHLPFLLFSSLPPSNQCLPLSTQVNTGRILPTNLPPNRSCITTPYIRSTHAQQIRLVSFGSRISSTPNAFAVLTGFINLKYSASNSRYLSSFFLFPPSPRSPSTHVDVRPQCRHQAAENPIDRSAQVYLHFTYEYERLQVRKRTMVRLSILQDKVSTISALLIRRWFG